MDVRMPDGTIVTNVPDNITQADLLGRYSASQQASTYDSFVPEVPTQEQVERAANQQPAAPRNFMDTVKDKFSGIREGFKGGGVPMLHLVKPQLEYMRDNPDVVGATVGSLLAPQLALPAWAAALSTGGSAAKIAAPIVQGAIRYAPQVAAAAAGGGAGGGLKEALREPSDERGAPTSESIISEAGKSALEMGASEGAGIAAFGLAGKIASPGAKFISEEGKRILDFAKEHGLKIKPSAVAPSGTAKAVEGFTNTVASGRAVKYLADRKIARVLDTANPEANNLISQVTKVYGENSPGLDPTIRSASKAIQEGLEQWTPKIEAKYDKFTTAIGGRDRLTDYPALREVFENIKTSEAALAGGKDEVTVGFASNFLGKYSGQISADDLYKQYKRLGHLKGADKRNIGIIRDAFKKEFEVLASETGDDAVKLLGEANKEYALGKKYFKNNPTVKKIVSGDIPDNQVTVRLFRDGEYGTLRQLQANVPKENFDNLLRLNLETLVQNNSIKGDNPFINILDGKKLIAWIDKNPKTFALYPKETQEAVRNLALYAKYHAPEALAGSKDFMSAMQSSAMKTGAIGGLMKFAGADMSGAGVVVPSVAAPAIAWDMMNPKFSLMKKWLLGGERLGVGTEQGLKVGGRLVFQDSLDE